MNSAVAKTLEWTGKVVIAMVAYKVVEFGANKAEEGAKKAWAWGKEKREAKKAEKAANANKEETKKDEKSETGSSEEAASDNTRKATGTDG